MPIDVSTHPEFQAKQAKFRADKMAATTAGDEVAQAKADAEWQRELSVMTADLYQRQDSERERQAAIARIKAENPAAPPEIFEAGDLAQIEKAAKAVQAVAGQAQTRQGGGTWTPPAGGGATGTPAEIDEANMTPDQRENARIKRMNELAPTVLRRGALARDENEELQRLSLRPLTERFHGRQQ